MVFTTPFAVAALSKRPPFELDQHRYMAFHQQLSSGLVHSHFVELFDWEISVGCTQVMRIKDLGKVSTWLCKLLSFSRVSGIPLWLPL